MRFVLVACLAVGCGGDGDRKTSDPPKAAVDGAFCEEHGVMEAVCTKCNPKLIPVFKAKGDWCDEHGFPESFCPTCNPAAGGKPVADVSSDEAPADGLKIRFKTKEAAAAAGIEVAEVDKRPGGARLSAIATVVYDATLHAEINARAPGVVKRLSVDVGSKVSEGDPLATIDSAAVGSERSRLRAADARVAIAETELEREEKLHGKGISSEREVFAARRELEEARATQAAARASLRMVGAGGGGASAYVLRAPLGGVVTTRHATIGHMVGLDAVLFEIVDTRTMWVEIDVPEDRLVMVAAGQTAVISLDADPGREWRGAIDYVATAVDPRTRTATARVALDNPDGVLRANMYGTALIELADARPTVMVPRQALQRAGGVDLVFVRLARDVFEARRVKVGLREGETIEIREGVEPGEKVATRGSFLLKTETLKGSIGAGCCDVE